jgi:hypothetical protein
MTGHFLGDGATLLATGREQATKLRIGSLKINAAITPEFDFRFQCDSTLTGDTW